MHHISCQLINFEQNPMQSCSITYEHGCTINLFYRWYRYKLLQYVGIVRFTLK